MTIGIYAIVHIASGRRYIGASKDVYRRLGFHRVALLEGTHHCRALAELWQTDPRSASFDFSFLFECRADELDRLEQAEIDRAMADGLCLNTVTSPLVKQIMDERGRRRRDRARDEMMALRAEELAAPDVYADWLAEQHARNAPDPAWVDELEHDTSIDLGPDEPDEY
jgi:hypothetical protein